MSGDMKDQRKQAAARKRRIARGDNPIEMEALHDIAGLEVADAMINVVYR